MKILKLLKFFSNYILYIRYEIYKIYINLLRLLFLEKMIYWNQKQIQCIKLMVILQIVKDADIY